MGCSITDACFVQQDELWRGLRPRDNPQLDIREFSHHVSWGVQKAQGMSKVFWAMPFCVWLSVCDQIPPQFSFPSPFVLHYDGSTSLAFLTFNHWRAYLPHWDLDLSIKRTQRWASISSLLDLKVDRVTLNHLLMISLHQTAPDRQPWLSKLPSSAWILFISELYKYCREGMWIPVLQSAPVLLLLWSSQLLPMTLAPPPLGCKSHLAKCWRLLMYQIWTWQHRTDWMKAAMLLRATRPSETPASQAWLLRVSFYLLAYIIPVDLSSIDLQIELRDLKPCIKCLGIRLATKFCPSIGRHGIQEVEDYQMAAFQCNSGTAVLSRGSMWAECRN